VLTAGIKALGELREQWAKLVTFFQMIRNLIKGEFQNQENDECQVTKCPMGGQIWIPMKYGPA
jgi:hypothetical protein